MHSLSFLLLSAYTCMINPAMLLSIFEIIFPQQISSLLVFLNSEICSDSFPHLLTLLTFHPHKILALVSLSLRWDLVVLVILTFYYPSVNQLFLFQSFSHPLYSEIVIDAGPFVREFAQLAMDEDIGTASREKAVLIGERRVGRKTIKILSQNVATFWGEHNLLGFLFEDKPIKLDSRFGL